MRKRGTRCSARQHRLIHKARKERLYSGNDELDAESHQQQPHNTGNHVNAGLPKQANQPGGHTENAPAAQREKRNRN